MPDVSLVLEDFSGAITSVGADFGAWVQQAQTGAGAVKAFYRDGSGFLKQSGISSLPCYITQPMPYVGFMPAGTLEEVYEIRFVWQADYDSNTTFRVCARFLPGQAYLSGGHQGGYCAQVKGGIMRVIIDNVEDNVYYEFFEQGGAVVGHEYILQLRLKTHAAGSTNLAARYADATVSPTTWIKTYTADAINDSTAAYNDQAAQYSWGISAEGSAYVKTDWNIDEAQLLKAIADVTGPVLGTLVIPESGTCGRIPVIDTPNYNPPVLPAPTTNVTGLSCRRSQDSGATWSNFPILNPVWISQDTAYPGRIDFAFASAVASTDQIDYSYDPATGNITDSNSPTPNPASAVTHSLATNYSLYDPTAVSTKSVMILGDRGFARTNPDTNGTKDVEAQSAWMQDLPYGASAGWVVNFLGHDPTAANETIQIKGAAVWIQQTPDEPRIRIPLTFGGLATATVAPNAILTSDPIQIDVRPGARIWNTQWYRSTLNSGSAGLPYLTYAYVRELLGTGAEDQDGFLIGAFGSMTDHTINGGFDHTATPPNNTAAYVTRAWGPMSITGKPHPTFTGTEVVPCWIGDSTAVQQNDANDDQTPEMARGYNLRYCAHRYPAIVFGQAGSVSGGFRALEGTAVFQHIFGVDGVGRKVTHVYGGYGLNGPIRTDTGIAGGAANAEWGQRVLDVALVKKNGCLYIPATITTFKAAVVPDGDVSAGSDATVAVQQRNLYNWMVRQQWHTLDGACDFADPASQMEYDFLNGTCLYYTGGPGEIHPDTPGSVRWMRAIRGNVFESHPNPMSGLSLQVTATASGSTVVLTWQADPGATGYKLFRAAAQDGPYSLIATVGASPLTYTDTPPYTGEFWYTAESVR